MKTMKLTIAVLMAGFTASCGLIKPDPVESEYKQKFRDACISKEDAAVIEENSNKVYALCSLKIDSLFDNLTPPVTGKAAYYENILQKYSKLKEK